jgi:hypothetical protein
MDDADCVGMNELLGRDIFFEEKIASDRSLAQSICHGCAVAEECMDYGLAFDMSFGIWGGATRHMRALIVDGKVTVAEHFAWLRDGWKNPNVNLYARPFKLRATEIIEADAKLQDVGANSPEGPKRRKLRVVEAGK